MARDFRDLIVWQKAMDLVEQVYLLTREWPASERFGLVSQIRRAAVSVPSNIAEGDGRGGDTELLRFLGIAHGSFREVETQLTIAVRLKFKDIEKLGAAIDCCGDVGRLLNGLFRKLRGK
jgi:four helix bundle protein